MMLALATLAISAHANPGQVTESSPHYDLEVMYGNGQYDEGLQVAKSRFAENPDDADLTWHIARFLFEIGESKGRHDASVDKEALYAEMVDWTDKGLAINPDDPHLRFVRGVGNGRLGTTRGVIASLWSAQGIERDWLAVSNSGFNYRSVGGDEVLPCDADLALGIFYRLVPDMWIVQMIAGTRGSLEKSESHLSSANQCEPGRIGTIKELGVTQVCRGTSSKDDAKIAAGKATLRQALNQPATNKLERIDHGHIRQILDNPSMACGYSRDGQQNLDTKKLAKN